MANTQTTVPAFVASQVLTAEQMTQSASTGVPVFATTVTRDAGFGNSGQKALAQGQLCYLEATDVVQYYDGSAWATLAPAPPVSAGLVFIAGGSISDTTSVNSCFSATYLNYRIILSNLVSGTSSGVNLRMRVSGADNTVSVYTYSNIAPNNASPPNMSDLGTAVNDNKFQLGYGNNYTNGQTVAIDLFSPFATFNTHYGPGIWWNSETTYSGTIAGVYKSATSFDGFTIYPAASTLTGTYKIYGYANS